jgi:DNA-binding MarR family transcriptional regulator
MREQTASYLIGRTDRIVRAQLEEALLESGLSLPEFTALSVLASRPGLSNARLARRSLVTPQAMHKVVRSLERAGLVERTALPEGGRALATTITTAGAAMVAELLPRIEQAEDRTLQALDASERRELVRLLTLATSVRPAPTSSPSGRPTSGTTYMQ